MRIKLETNREGLFRRFYHWFYCSADSAESQDWALSRDKSANISLHSPTFVRCNHFLCTMSAGALCTAYSSAAVVICQSAKGSCHYFYLRRHSDAPRPLDPNYIVLFMGIFAINNILYVPRMPQPDCHIQMARRTALNYMCAAVRCGVQRLLRNVIMQLNASPFQCSTFHLHMKDLSRRAGPKNKKCQWIEMAFGGNYEMDGMEGRWRWRKAENYCNKEPIKGLTMSGARHREEKFFNYKFKFKKHLSCQRLYHRERAVCECE